MDAGTGKLADSPRESWKSDLKVVKASIPFLYQTGILSRSSVMRVVLMKLGVKELYLLLGPSAALYFQWVCGGMDVLVRQSSTKCNMARIREKYPSNRSCSHGC